MSGFHDKGFHIPKDITPKNSNEALLNRYSKVDRHNIADLTIVSPSKYRNTQFCTSTPNHSFMEDDYSLEGIYHGELSRSGTPCSSISHFKVDSNRLSPTLELPTCGIVGNNAGSFKQFNSFLSDDITFSDICGGSMSEDDSMVVDPLGFKTPKPYLSHIPAMLPLVNHKRKMIENVLTKSSVLDKICDVTPKPSYDGMSNEELNKRLQMNGLAKCGKKKAIVLLNKIYEQNHPICTLEETFVDCPNGRKRKLDVNCEPVIEINEYSDSFNSSSSSSGNDETLNPNMEYEKETNPKSKSQFKTLFIMFMRKPENEIIYNQMLRGEVIKLDEVYALVKRSTHAIRKISKPMLMQVLDSSTLPCKMPDDGWKRKAKKG
uniref:SAP domain-containing protein n=1 Tax=Rhabditophanes sp. KR3021 TaxID=114890 RepID=A0AC35UHI7_9BILA